MAVFSSSPGAGEEDNEGGSSTARGSYYGFEEFVFARTLVRTRAFGLEDALGFSEFHETTHEKKNRPEKRPGLVPVADLLNMDPDFPGVPSVSWGGAELLLHHSHHGSGEAGDDGPDGR